MAIPAHRRSANIIKSVFKWIEDEFATPGGYTVDYDEPNFDSDIIQEHGSSITRWVRLRVLSAGAGQKGELLLQCDCVGKFGEGAAEDEYGADFYDMVDDLRDALATHCIPVYQSFAGGGPTATGDHLRVQATGKRGHGFGVPQDESGPRREDGQYRLILTYRIISQEDGSGSPYYD
jgi:hypothetical protein